MIRYNSVILPPDRYDNINTIIPGVLVIGCMIWCFVVVLLFGCTYITIAVFTRTL